MPRKQSFNKALVEHEKEQKNKFKKPRNNDPVLPKQKDWFEDLLKDYGNENVMFEQMKIKKKVFYHLLELVENTPLKSAGRVSYFRTHKSKLLLLLLYLRIGNPHIIAMLTTPEIKHLSKFFEVVNVVLYPNHILVHITI